MATRIIDIDLDTRIPDAIDLGGRNRLFVIAWQSGAPAGVAWVDGAFDEKSVDRETLARALRPVRETASPAAPASSAPLPSVSVVVCTRDRPDRLPIALQALRRQTHTDFELVVVDNAPSDDRTRRALQSLWPEAHYVVEPVPGLPRARNTGVLSACGDILAFTDDDCRPVPGWVETLARSFAAEPRTGCVTGPILPLELETPAQEAMEARGGFNRGFQRRTFTPDRDGGPVYPVQAWQFGAGGSMALSRECLRSLGGFDEALLRSEDMDIFYRALRAGYAIAFEPGAAVRHRHLPTWKELRERMYDWGWGYLTMLDKIARTDTPRYAARARRERRAWLRYQLSKRLFPALVGRADLPLSLVVREIAGGIAGFRSYGGAAAERGDGTTPGARGCPAWSGESRGIP